MAAGGTVATGDNSGGDGRVAAGSPVTGVPGEDTPGRGFGRAGVVGSGISGILNTRTAMTPTRMTAMVAGIRILVRGDISVQVFEPGKEEPRGRAMAFVTRAERGSAQVTRLIQDGASYSARTEGPAISYQGLCRMGIPQ